MPPQAVLAVESMIASAHRSCFTAERISREIGYEGLADDLSGIQVELARLQEDLLRTRRSLRAPGGRRAYQLEFDGSDPRTASR